MKNSRTIRVMQIVDGFGGGGAERKLLELIRETDRSCFETVICSLGLLDTIRCEFDALNVKIVILKMRHKYDRLPLLQLYRLIRRERIDVIMTTLFWSDIMAGYVGKLAGAKAVFFWETISTPEWLAWPRLLAYRIAVRFIDCVISVSHSTARFLVEKRRVPRSKVKVIQYGVDLRQFYPTDGMDVRRELGINKDQPVIGMVGLFRPQKGHAYLIQAARELVCHMPGLKIILVGSGPMQKQVQEKIDRAGLNNTFILTGKREDVNRYLGAFDIFTLPSLFEGLPNVILEAMAASKPVVATWVDGSKELVVDKETGLLVAPRDIDGLTMALLDLLKNPEKARRMGRNGRRRVEERFSLRLQMERFQSLYKEYYFRNTGLMKTI
ncbi:MAG TPA: glycosyltransferase [bacterium]|nr:glycosyltransferase [bacterium]